MENETEVIKQQMAETRTALSEKLEAVEELVASTVKETTETVSETVAAVTDTVESTVNTVADSVESVKESVKEAFDVKGYVEKYPWLVLGGAFAAGYALGHVLGPSSSYAASYSSWAGPSESYEPAVPPAAPSPASYTSAPAAPREDTSSWLQGLMPVIDKLKGLAIGTAAGVVGEMVLKNLPDNLRSEVSKLIDDTTSSLGGPVLRHKS